MRRRLSEGEIVARLRGLSGWQLRVGRLLGIATRTIYRRMKGESESLASDPIERLEAEHDA